MGNASEARDEGVRLNINYYTVEEWPDVENDFIEIEDQFLLATGPLSYNCENEAIFNVAQLQNSTRLHTIKIYREIVTIRRFMVVLGGMFFGWLICERIFKWI